MTNMNGVPGPGGPQSPASVPPITEPGKAGREINRDARMWATFCHLAALATFVATGVGLVFGPLVVWLIKKEQYPFVDEQGKEAVNFQISMLVPLAIGALLVLAGAVGPIGFVRITGVGLIMIGVLGILDMAFVVIAAIKANDGYHYQYPFGIRFIK